MKEIKRFIECLIPVTACNMRCSYCYVIQESRREDKVPDLKYGLDVISYATRQERFGGPCFFSICGAGETLIPPYTIDLIEVFLNNGHYVNVTTNGTLSRRFDEILSRFDVDQFSKMQFAFSYHYLELKRLNKLEEFFGNILRVHNAGASIVVQMNLCDEYVPFLEEAVSLCKQYVGAAPQFAITRREDGYPVRRVSFDTKMNEDQYIATGEMFDSNLFNVGVKNFNKNRRTEFCYAGDWSFSLNLVTGIMRRCYCSCFSQNIFENPSAPLRLLAVGKNCNSPYCFNATHFLALGTIPQTSIPSYVELRDRPEAHWYQNEIKDVLSKKLSNCNREYSQSKKALSAVLGSIDTVGYKLYSFVMRYWRNR